MENHLLFLIIFYQLEEELYYYNDNTRTNHNVLERISPTYFPLRRKFNDRLIIFNLTRTIRKMKQSAEQQVLQSDPNHATTLHKLSYPPFSKPDTLTNSCTKHFNISKVYGAHCANEYTYNSGNAFPTGPLRHFD